MVVPLFPAAIVTRLVPGMSTFGWPSTTPRTSGWPVVLLRETSEEKFATVVLAEERAIGSFHLTRESLYPRPATSGAKEWPGVAPNWGNTWSAGVTVATPGEAIAKIAGRGSVARSTSAAATEAGSLAASTRRMGLIQQSGSAWPSQRVGDI